MSTLRTILLVLLAAAGLTAAGAVPAAAAAACPGADEVQGPKRTASAVRCLVNQERRAQGLRSLKAHPRLRRAARRQARGIVRTRVFAHQVPGVPAFSGRLRAARYVARAAAENLAWAGGDRANVLSPAYRHLGVSAVRKTPDGGRGVTVAAAFGTRR